MGYSHPPRCSRLIGEVLLQKSPRMVGVVAREVEPILADAFLAGYATVAPIPASSALRWYTAAALLMERALRAVNRVRPLGLANLHTILADARDLLQVDSWPRPHTDADQQDSTPYAHFGGNAL